MTPFMLEVQATVADHPPAVAPRTAPSRTRPVAQAADSQVLVRSLAEQLVSEANAVLSERDERIGLVDEAGPGCLGFTLSYRDRTARVRTTVTGRAAVASLDLGAPDGETRELAGEDELRALLLSLLTR